MMAQSKELSAISLVASLGPTKPRGQGRSSKPPISCKSITTTVLILEVATISEASGSVVHLTGGAAVHV